MTFRYPLDSERLRLLLVVPREGAIAGLSRRYEDGSGNR